MKVLSGIFKFVGSLNKAYQYFGVLIETFEFAQARLKEKGLLKEDIIPQVEAPKTEQN